MAKMVAHSLKLVAHSPTSVAHSLNLVERRCAHYCCCCCLDVFPL
jgi:hypothetical protein